MTADATAAPEAPTSPGTPSTPTAALERQGVTPDTRPDATPRPRPAEPSSARTSSPSRPRNRAGRRSSASTATRCRSSCSRPASSACSCPARSPTGVVLIGLTLLNAAMGLNQEGKASASVAALQKMMVVKAKVRRDGALAELPMEQLVPGDIVNIEAGDLVPADGRILTAATLEIDESALTGESVPVPKQVDAVAADAALGDRVDMAFMNTQVTRGAGTILVTDTGMATEVGHISGMLQRDEGRGDAADQAAQRADQPDPRHRRRRAADLDRHRPLARHALRRAVPDARSRSRSRPSRPACRRSSRRSCRGAPRRSPRPARS